MTKKEKAENILGWSFTLLLFLLFGVVNYMTNFVTDDLWYGTNLVTGEPLSNFKDIMESQIWHYNNWGGRIVAHTLLQFTLLGGRIFADVCNQFMISLLLILVCWYCGKISWQICLFVMGAIIFFNPAWWDNLLWQSGSANYLYTTNFILLFMIIFLKALEKEYDKKMSIFLCIIMPLLGFMAGCSNENMGPVAFLTGIIVAGSFIYKKKKVSIWMIIGELTCAFGCAVMLLSPGNKVRSKQIPITSGEGIKELIKNFVFKEYVKAGWPLFHVMLPIIILLLFSFIVLKAIKLKFEWCEIVFSLMAALSYLAMLFSPHYPDRATYGTIILIICVISRILTRIGKERPDLVKYGQYMILAVDFGMMYTLVFYVFQMKEYLR